MSSESLVKLTAQEEEKCLSNIKNSLRSYPDFPKKGICFWDIFSILNQPSLTKDLLKLLENSVLKQCPDVDAFVGLDSRGFLFGLPLALTFGKPFIPIRKKGKLPGTVKKVSYQLEYGEDSMEIQDDALKPNQRVVVVDDLLATGGTLEAANALVTQCNANVALNLLCIELRDLKGRERLSTPVVSLFHL